MVLVVPFVECVLRLQADAHFLSACIRLDMHQRLMRGDSEEDIQAYGIVCRVIHRVSIMLAMLPQMFRPDGQPLLRHDAAEENPGCERHGYHTGWYL